MHIKKNGTHKQSPYNTCTKYYKKTNIYLYNTSFPNGGCPKEHHFDQVEAVWTWLQARSPTNCQSPTTTSLQVIQVQFYNNG